MPEKIILEDGTEREVPTEEEIKNLQNADEKNKERKEQETKLREELGIGEDEDLWPRVQELKESESPNWKAVRDGGKKKEKEIADLKDKLKESGVETGENKSLSQEDLDKRISEKISDTTLKNKREELLLGYNDVKEKELMEHYIDKMMTGEEQTIANLIKAKEEAERLAFPERKQNLVNKVMNAPGSGSFSLSKNDKVSDDAKIIGKSIGNTSEDLEKGGDVSDLLLNNNK